MGTVQFVLHIRGLKPLLVCYFRVEEKFAGGKFRAKSKFAKIAKINSTRKIGVIQYSISQNRRCLLNLVLARLVAYDMTYTFIF